MNIQQSKDEQVENGSNPIFTSSEYYFLTFQIITLFSFNSLAHGCRSLI